jgi:hypothetical protein
MAAKHWAIAFGGGFVLFGLPLLVVEDQGWVRISAGLSTFCLGGFALAMVQDALGTGRIRLQHGTIHYASRPRLFWAAIALYAVAGLAMIGVAGWILFIKEF